jgi:hypothetical protein
MRAVMLVRLLEAHLLGDHRVRLRFDDGLVGEVDLGRELEGEVFEPLRNPGCFAPEFLHARVGRSKAS